MAKPSDRDLEYVKLAQKMKWPDLAKLWAQREVGVEVGAALHKRRGCDDATEIGIHRIRRISVDRIRIRHCSGEHQYLAFLDGKSFDAHSGPLRST